MCNFYDNRVLFFFRLLVTTSSANLAPLPTVISPAKPIKRPRSHGNSDEEQKVRKVEKSVTKPPDALSVYEFTEEDFDEVQPVLIVDEDSDTVQPKVKRGVGRPRKNVQGAELAEPKQQNAETKSAASTEGEQVSPIRGSDKKRKHEKRRSRPVKPPAAQTAVASSSGVHQKSSTKQKKGKGSSKAAETSKTSKAAAIHPKKVVVTPTAPSERTFYTQERLQAFSGQNFDDEEGSTEWFKILAHKQVSSTHFCFILSLTLSTFFLQSLLFLG